MDASDGDLVARVRNGERAAFGALTERHRPLALRLALRMLNDSAEAEDAAQEACLHAFLSLSRLREPKRFGAWLGGIAVNLCRLRLKQRARRITYALEDWDGGRVAQGFAYSEVEPSPEAVCEMRELHQIVQSAIALLPPEQQTVVRLHYLDGLTLAEIGVIAGRPLGTVKARLHRARERLRAELLREFTEPQPRKEKPGMIEVEIKDVVMRVLNPPKDVLESASREAPGPEAPEFRIPLPPPGVHPVMWVKGDEQSAQPMFGPSPFGPFPAPPIYRVVLLKEKNGERLLPIWIGPHEADMIALQLAGNSAPRPLTFDLALRLLEAAKASIERVTVNRLHEEVFYSIIYLRVSGQTHEMDARPSDALNLALRAKAPIFVDETVMATAGTTPDQLDEKLNEHKPGAPEAGSQDYAQFVWVSAPPPDMNPPKREPPEKK